MLRRKRQAVGAVIAAAGTSERMDGVDKIVTQLGGKPVLVYVIDTFVKCDAIEQIVVVLTERNMVQVQQLVTEQGWEKVPELCPGGQRRQDSVLAGLNRLKNCEWVVIHDGARPLVTVDLIKRGLEEAEETGAAAAAIRVTDTIKVVGVDRMVRHTPARETLWAVQTPQVFRFDIIHEAYRRLKGEVTDDAEIVEQMGYQKVKLYMGSYDNIKITTPADLVLAEALLQKRGE
jgi:2-C-methyl-D-erythritol 4-phosphate cytidylyltransferase